MANHCDKFIQNSDEKCKTLIIKGTRGQAGERGVPGLSGTGIGKPSSQYIVPQDNITILKIDPDKNLVIIDTSNFSPTLTLGAPTCGENKSNPKKICNCSSP